MYTTKVAGIPGGRIRPSLDNDAVLEITEALRLLRARYSEDMDIHSMMRVDVIASGLLALARKTGMLLHKPGVINTQAIQQHALEAPDAPTVANLEHPAAKDFVASFMQSLEVKTQQ